MLPEAPWVIVSPPTPSTLTFTSSAASVSTISAFCNVAVPVFATVIRYANGDPMPAGTVTRSLVAVNATVAGCAVNPVAFESCAAIPHVTVPIAVASFPTGVAAHTGPTAPVIVNVNACPGSTTNAGSLHANCVAEAPPVTTAADANVAG